MKAQEGKTNRIYRGFDLSKVTWGYREIFRNAIDDLLSSGLIGDGNPDSTEIFFRMLKRQNEGALYDHVLKNFLLGLNGENAWILRIPRLFGDWSSLGAELASHKLHLGMRYFELWGQGAFGDSPEELSYVIAKARFLLDHGHELAFGFISSFSKLRKRLSFVEMDSFVESALVLHGRNPERALEFIGLKTKTSNFYVRMISKESRLAETSARLKLYASAIADMPVGIDGISKLDSDEIIASGSSVVCMASTIYLPEKVALFNSRGKNNDLYRLLSAVSASSLLFRSFSTVHGLPGSADSLEHISARVTGNKELVNNCFIFLETARVLRLMMDRFPGISGALAEALTRESKGNPACSLLSDLVKARSSSAKSARGGAGASVVGEIAENVLDRAESFDDTLREIADFASGDARTQSLGSIFANRPAPLSFFPDFMFHGTISNAPLSSVALDLGSPATRNGDGMKDGGGTRNGGGGEIRDGEKRKRKEDDGGIEAGFLYDEWNQGGGDYFEKWCLLRERSVPSGGELRISPEHLRLADRVRRFFETLKPDLARKEKGLPEGDDINIDQLMDFISLRKARICPGVKFYEKPRIRRRDVCVALLMDISGSTSDATGHGGSVIEIERISAYILGEGLSQTGDKFGIFGFSGSGRRNAEFFVLKDFDSGWDMGSQSAVFNASPRSSTRIGVALRHAGRKLSATTSRKKILILITDGKPMDSEYDHGNRYAQFDVRKANEENSALGIDSFCISTEENSAEDLDLMFPNKRSVIINGMEELPALLSRFYLRLTK